MNSKLDEIKSALRNVYDPELPTSIYELGLIYDIKIEDKDVFILISLTSPSCPASSDIVANIEENIKNIKWVSSVKVDITLCPAYHPEMMSDIAKIELEL